MAKRSDERPVARNAVTPLANSVISELVNNDIHPENWDLPADFIVDCVLTYRMDSNNDKEKDKNKVKDMKEKAELRKKFHDILHKQNLTITQKESSEDKTVYVHIENHFKTMLSTAEKIRMKLPIEVRKKENNEATQAPKTHKIPRRWQKVKSWIEKRHTLDSKLLEIVDPDVHTLTYSPGNPKFSEHFDTLRGSREKYFTPTERALLTYELLSRTHGLDELLKKGVYASCFPLHESLQDQVKSIDDDKLNNRERLRKHWATLRQWHKYQPMNWIRDYFGERVAFYFAILGFYTQMLIPAAAFGGLILLISSFIFWTSQNLSDICGPFGNSTYMCPICDRSCSFEKLSNSCANAIVTDLFDNILTLIFTGFMSIWARLFVEFWKRRQAELQYEWDLIGFVENNEPIRAAYERQAGDNKKPSPITNEDEPYNRPRKRDKIYSIAFVSVMLLVVCLHVVGTIAYRVWIGDLLNRTSVKSFTFLIVSVTSAIINLIVGLILSKFFYFAVCKLTDREMHKRQSHHDRSLTIKIGLFEFFNTYAPIFYIAFFKGRFVELPSKYGQMSWTNLAEQCSAAGCFSELTIQFAITLFGRTLLQNIREYFAVYWQTIKWYCCCCCCCGCAGECLCRCKKGESMPTAAKEDSRLEDFDSMVLLQEYLEIMLQFGLVVLFSAAFPLAPVLALINNIIEIRLDAWKFLTKYKRPIPFRVADIGIWNSVLSGLSYLGLVTNAVIIAWTSEFIPKTVYRMTVSHGYKLDGYVNWTLSSFPIADYNLTNTLGTNLPENLTYCRYRDFRETNGPNYEPTIAFWNVLAARLAFVVLFEHLLFFIVCLIQWCIPDVPKDVENKIKRERFLDHNARWNTPSPIERFVDTGTKVINEKRTTNNPVHIAINAFSRGRSVQASEKK